jgi:hypothetical protein
VGLRVVEQGGTRRLGRVEVEKSGERRAGPWQVALFVLVFLEANPFVPKKKNSLCWQELAYYRFN